MHFDDRLATVLRNSASSPAVVRAQFRQLIDLLGTLSDGARSDTIDAAYMRLGDLAAAIPARDRAAILNDTALRLRSPRLISQLAQAEPAVAAAAIAQAQLGRDQWLDMIPALPVAARGIVRHRKDLGTAVEALLGRLGIADRGLPPGEGAFAAAPPPEARIKSERAAPPSPLPTPRPPAPIPADPPPQIDEIGAIVRRIEAFRKTRAAADTESAEGDPRLPLGEAEITLSARAPDAFDFATDAEGRVAWAEPAVAPAVVGLRLATRDLDNPVSSSAESLNAFRHRQPITQAPLTILGAPAISGEWRIDAAPRFDRPNGRFVGYLGRLRRPAPADAAAAEQGGDNGEADRMRQILHELRTPINAIQGFAEVIQQQYFGYTPHEYRALAATVVSDAARMLAAFDELDRLVRLDSGAMALDAGICDLLPILQATIAQLDAFNAPRGSGLALECDAASLPVALDQAEAERIVWRLLATLAGTTAPGEVLRLRARLRETAGKASVRLVLRLPASLVGASDDALFHAAPSPQPSALAAGTFGTGFALRLAAAEARAAGGALVRRDHKLRLSLPAVPTMIDREDPRAHAVAAP